MWGHREKVTLCEPGNRPSADAEPGQCLEAASRPIRRKCLSTALLSHPEWTEWDVCILRPAVPATPESPGHWDAREKLLNKRELQALKVQNIQNVSYKSQFLGAIFQDIIFLVMFFFRIYGSKQNIRSALHEDSNRDIPTWDFSVPSDFFSPINKSSNCS